MSSAARDLSPSLKEPLDIFQFQFHMRRPSMVALACVQRLFHVPQKSVHLLDLELAAGADRMIASHGGEHAKDALFEALTGGHLAQITGDAADQCSVISPAEDGRHFAQDNGTRAERLDNETESLQEFTLRLEPSRRNGIEIDNLRNQKRLGAQCRIRQLLLHLLVDDPLMRRMLVNDDEALGG